MANLLQIADLAWLQMFPKGSDESPITREEFQSTAESEAAYQIWLQMFNERNTDGYYEVGSHLLKEIEVPVVDKVADLSCYPEILRGLPKDIWLQKVGSLTCECKYIKSTVNLMQLLDDEDSRGHAERTYVVVGKTLKFPQGVHKNPIKLIVASLGEDESGEINVSDEIAGIVRQRLVEIYTGRTGQEDATNNGNPIM